MPAIWLSGTLTPQASGDNVLFRCGGEICRVFGATCPVTAPPGENTTTFTAHLPPDQERGLLAVAAYYRVAGDRCWEGYVIELTRDSKGHVHANLERAWVPAGAQIAQVDHIGIHLTDVASGERFTTDAGTAQKHRWTYVPNGNLLLSFLAGEKTVDDVRAAAIACVEEKLVREQLVELEARARTMEARVDDLGRENERLHEIERVARLVRGDLLAVGCTEIPQTRLGLYAALDKALGG